MRAFIEESRDLLNAVAAAVLIEGVRRFYQWCGRIATRQPEEKRMIYSSDHGSASERATVTVHRDPTLFQRFLTDQGALVSDGGIVATKTTPTGSEAIVESLTNAARVTTSAVEQLINPDGTVAWTRTSREL
jgi:hypothetical protein